MNTALTLRQLNQRIGMLLSEPTLQNVWVVAELSDMRVSNGHCYMELIDKNPDTGAVLARLRAVIWANMFPRIDADFHAATGNRLSTGMKVMVCGSVNFHASFGISLVISAINASFTMGEVERKRREILARLKQEGVIYLNRSLEWKDVPLRIAIVSAPGAAGYGDFIHQLYGNGMKLRFHTGLFPALMQGERTSASVIAALEAIAADMDSWDCVVIIRGGGATSDLIAFDDYALASNVAQFPLPVIVGIGHERDVTVLDYVANMRVKTPTAAAEWLIGRGTAALELLHRVASDILLAANDKIAGANMHLAYSGSSLGMAPLAVVQRASARLRQDTVTLAGAGVRRVVPEYSRIGHKADAIDAASRNAVKRHADILSAKDALLGALSPAATLRRGYSITMSGGHAVRSVSELKPGSAITTIFADGTVVSAVTDIDK